jgi:hypothetical protein
MFPLCDALRPGSSTWTTAVVHIDDPGVGNEPLGDFMEVALRRQAGSCLAVGHHTADIYPELREFARRMSGLARAVRIGAVGDARDDDRYLLVLDQIQDAVLAAAG